jgi:hypothetical protein
MRERVINIPKCRVPECRDDAAPGFGEHCRACGQAIRRRAQKQYGDAWKDELIARGKWAASPIDKYLRVS